MTTDLDQLALDTAVHIEDLFVQPHNSVNQRRARLQVLLLAAFDRSGHQVSHQKPDAEGWIYWAPTEYNTAPVGDRVWVECRFDNTDSAEYGYAGSWRWDNVPGWRNITAYRVVKEDQK